MYDTANEVTNRIRALNPGDRPKDPLDPAIVQQLLEMLDAHNHLAQKFRLARDRLEKNADDEFIIRLVGAREGDPVQYNLPTVD